MEKIKVNNREFELAPMGIKETDKRRSFTISTDLACSTIEKSFTDVSNIQYLSESGEVLAAYLDGVGTKSITKDLEDGTYTIVISTDTVEAELKQLRAQVAALTQ